MDRSSALLICVNYRDDEGTSALVHNVLADHDHENLRILVVDNNEGPIGIDLERSIKGLRPKVLLFRPGQNLGYFGGAARGLKDYLSSHPLPEWIVVSNVDISLPGKEFFRRLSELGSTHKHAVLAPAIMSELTGRDQNPYMVFRPTQLRMKFYKTVFQYYPLLVSYSLLSLLIKKVQSNWHSQKINGPSGSEERLVPSQIYAPHGSFIAFRDAYFNAGGTLGHGVFLFGEEIFVAETVRRLGLTIGYDPRLQVIHREHKTTGYFPSREIARYISEAAAYSADKFFRNSD